MYKSSAIPIQWTIHAYHQQQVQPCHCSFNWCLQFELLFASHRKIPPPLPNFSLRGCWAEPQLLMDPAGSSKAPALPALGHTAGAALHCWCNIAPQSRRQMERMWLISTGAEMQYPHRKEQRSELRAAALRLPTYPLGLAQGCALGLRLTLFRGDVLANFSNTG